MQAEQAEQPARRRRPRIVGLDRALGSRMLSVDQQVGRMLQSRGCIELVVCMDEAQLHKESLRCDILWIVTGEECLDSEFGERMLDYPCRRLERVALPPVAG